MLFKLKLNYPCTFSKKLLISMKLISRVHLEFCKVCRVEQKFKSNYAIFFKFCPHTTIHAPGKFIISDVFGSEFLLFSVFVCRVLVMLNTLGMTATRRK